MNKQSVIQRAKAHLQVLCSEIGERRVGSEANRQSTAYAEKVLKQLGWPAESTRLSVIDWHTDGAMLTSILLHYWSREGRKPWCVPPGAMLPLRGGVYPFPMFEDGDFDILSVYAAIPSSWWCSMAKITTEPRGR